MDLNKLFGSRAKVDILKYLIFKREGISLRALESDLERTFPAIKKQVDALEAAHVIHIDKEQMKWSISINPAFMDHVRGIFLFGMQEELKSVFTGHRNKIHEYFRGKLFGNDLDMDIVLIYHDLDKDEVQKIKDTIGEICKDYFVSQIAVTCMSQDEREKRQRLADRFVLNILRSTKK